MTRKLTLGIFLLTITLTSCLGVSNRRSSVGQTTPDPLVLIYWVENPAAFDLKATLSTNGGSTFSAIKTVASEASAMSRMSSGFDGNTSASIAWWSAANTLVSFRSFVFSDLSFKTQKDFALNTANPSLYVKSGKTHLVHTAQGASPMGYTSTSDGTTFAHDPVLGITPTDVANGGNWTAITVGTDGVIHAIFSFIVNADSTMDMAYTRSTDGGTTFSTPVIIYNNLVVGAGTWPLGHTVYASNSLVEAAFSYGTPSAIYYVKSEDNGVTWGSPLQVSTVEAAHHRYPTFVKDGSGNAHMVWRKGTAGAGSVLYSKSTDGGDSFAAATVISDGANTGTPYMAVSSSGSAFFVWTESSRVKFKSLPSGGALSATTNLDGGVETPTNPRIRYDQLGVLHIVWEQNNGATDSVMYVRSTDNGATFSTPVAIDSGLTTVNDVNVMTP